MSQNKPDTHEMLSLWWADIKDGLKRFGMFVFHNLGRIFFGSIVLCLLIWGVSGINSCIDKQAAEAKVRAEVEARAWKTREAEKAAKKAAEEEVVISHLIEMRIACDNDHFVIEQKIADGLWQIECRSVTGAGRLVYQERE